MNLHDIAEVWRRGSVIASWLLDLTAAALVEDQALSKFAGRVSDPPCWFKFEFQVSALSSATDMPTVEQLQARANYLFY